MQCRRLPCFDRAVCGRLRGGTTNLWEHFRMTGSGQNRKSWPACAVSGLPPKADVAAIIEEACEGQKQTFPHL